MKKVHGFEFYGIRNILNNGGYLYPASNWSLSRYLVRFSHGEEVVIPELKHVAMLENVDKRRAWIYEVDGKAFLIVCEIEPFNNHAQYQIVVEKLGVPPISFIKFGIVKLFENQVLAIENEEGVGEFVKKLLNKGWLLRFPSGSQAKAGY
jgi:hypothetical protein